MPKKNESTAKNNAYLLSLTLILNMLIVTSICYVNSSISVSRTCGPFTDPKLDTPLDYLFKLKGEYRALDLIMNLALQPGFTLFILFILW